MKKRGNILLLMMTLLLLVGVGVYGYMVANSNNRESIRLIKVKSVGDIMEETHGMMVFEDLNIDTMMLGVWQHTVDTGWHRVYTMEPAGNDYYWGREWNTSEDIFEEDLMPYGNGWFMWKKDGDEVVEIHMTDKQIAVIPFEYEIMELSSQEMRYKESTDADKQEFKKVKI